MISVKLLTWTPRKREIRITISETVDRAMLRGLNMLYGDRLAQVAEIVAKSQGGTVKVDDHGFTYVRVCVEKDSPLHRKLKKLSRQSKEFERFWKKDCQFLNGEWLTAARVNVEAWEKV